MSQQFFTVSMVEQELGYRHTSFLKALATKPVPPAAHIGQIAVYSKKQVRWLGKRTGQRAIVKAHPFTWSTPWDDKGEHVAFMATSDIARVLDRHVATVHSMFKCAPLPPDAVAGQYRGYLPATVAQWLGEFFPDRVTPEVLGVLNRFGQSE